MVRFQPMATSKAGKKRVLRGDDFVNTFTGLGDRLKDKRYGSKPVSRILDPVHEEALWRSDAIGSRIVETPADDMVRAGFELNVAEADRDVAEALMASYDELNANKAFFDARCSERAHGGGAILVGADDGQDLSEPLNEENIRSIEFLTVLSPQELKAEEWNRDFREPSYGEPKTWRLQNVIAPRRKDDIVHASRLIIFEGLQVGRKQVTGRYGWGDSVLTRCYTAIRDFDIGFSGAAALLPSFLQDIWKMKGFMDLVATNDVGAFLARIKGVEMSRSSVNATIIDADGEDFERKSVQVAGLAEILDRLAQRVAAAARMPLTLLMGISPAGLNATGESDIRLYYDSIASEREQRFRRRLNRLLKLMMLAKDGPTAGKEPDNWSVKFNPLWQPTQKEETETRLVQAKIDQIEVQEGILSAEEVAIARHGGDSYSYETTLDLAARKAVTPGEPDNASNPQAA